MASKEELIQHRYYVGYMDILGYKEFFTENPEDTDTFLVTINEAIEETVKQTNKNKEIIDENFRPRIKVFSDNILIAQRCRLTDRDNLGVFLNMVVLMTNIQLMFVNKYKLFIRGALVKGMLYFGDTYVFGEALIRAFEMESRQAIYPRILLEKEEVNKVLGFLNGIKKPPSQTIKGNFRSFLESICRVLISREMDGSYFINYLQVPNRGDKENRQFAIGRIFLDTSCAPNLNRHIEPDVVYDEKMKEILRGYLAPHRTSVISRIAESCHFRGIKGTAIPSLVESKRRVISKYIWVLEYHNQSCTIAGLNDLRIDARFVIDPRFHHPFLVVDSD